MPRMRHPKIPGAHIDVAEQAMPFHAVAGWLSDEEWARAGHPEPEKDDEATPVAEQDTKPSRRTPRATKGNVEDR